MAAEVTRVGPKYQVTIPKEVREKIGLRWGDLVQANLGNNGAIILRRRLRDPELERDLAEALADIKAGRYLGPFDTAEQVAGSLRRYQREHSTGKAAIQIGQHPK